MCFTEAITELLVKFFTDALDRARRQRSEQYLTEAQSFSHFLRQVKDKPQTSHSLLGKSDFLRIFMARFLENIQFQY
ncbi:hypothetical protein GCM10011282_25830 [Undibacterium macrobrachii]|uniref:Uncharacterized protein n=1 Tax=Undibacterium macrobrachii TaxID=1119058 RepID=A0ABQ2XI95_9BURK|nr:hypothetical protein GCM10011282_25830 [Undibacterium macrobrachii]